jgi:hypothetical protein
VVACLVALDKAVGPVNLLVCAACLRLHFFEPALGICMGCKTHERFNEQQARLCPGGVRKTGPAPRAGPGCPGVAHA